MTIKPPPVIPSVPEDGKPRPFWSVMIPAYNPPSDYLAETLRSVLAQDPGPEQMQIEVVDDCSPKINVAALVREIAGDRVKVSQTPKNLGLAGCWNTCLERSRGEWVHILHQDDLVMPGFYTALRKGAANGQQIGAAFSRYATINPAGHWLHISQLHRESAGMPDAWHETIAVHQHIQCPAIVVRRAVYEQLGGFLPELHYTLDWEMWQRIARHYSFWFEPSILAAYRVHPASATSRLRLEAADVREVRLTIERMMSNHPAPRAAILARQARRFYAGFAMENSRPLLVAGHADAAWKQVIEALRLSLSWPVLWQFVSFLILRMRIAGSQLKRRFRKTA